MFAAGDGESTAAEVALFTLFAEALHTRTNISLAAPQCITEIMNEKKSDIL